MSRLIFEGDTTKRFGEKLEDDEDFSSIDAYRWFGKVYVVGK